MPQEDNEEHKRQAHIALPIGIVVAHYTIIEKILAVSGCQGSMRRCHYEPT